MGCHHRHLHQSLAITGNEKAESTRLTITVEQVDLGAVPTLSPAMEKRYPPSPMPAPAASPTIRGLFVPELRDSTSIRSVQVLRRDVSSFYGPEDEELEMEERKSEEALDKDEDTLRRDDEGLGV
ncbi:hypothetical protein MNV49_007585 [Pseudohyphozyma bogoriensis]|nr:hypothetical protein MNV49_007585 [Pseudohyphozyma bogoriensis]